MNTFPDPPSINDSESTRLFGYYKSKGLSDDLAQKFVDGVKDSGSFEADPVGADASHIAVKIVANPDNYTPGIRALAAAYESRGERIADLEEDVERLRPEEEFASETIYAASSEDFKEIEIECLGAGLLRVTVNDTDEGCAVDIDLDEVQTTNLTTALAKWSGVDGDGVDWKPVGMFCGPSGLPALLTDGKRVDTGVLQFAGSIDWPYGNKPTHWAPLPKPPVVK